MVEKEQVQVKGLIINYKVVGEGQPVLVLHGWGSSVGTWESFQELLSKRGYKVYVLDLPGFGESQAPSKSWQVGDYTHFVLNVAGELGLDSFFLLGHSFGGRIAIQLAACYPHRLKGLVLCSAAGIKHELSPKQKFLSPFLKIAKTVIPSQKARDFIYSLIAPGDYRKVSGTMRETFKKVVAEDLGSYIPRIKAPTLIVWGEDDRMTPVEDAYEMNKNIQGSKLVIMSGVRHGVQIQEPAKLAEEVSNFLSTLS